MASTREARILNCPLTLACSSRTCPATLEPDKSRMPSRRSRVPSKAGTSLLAMRIVRTELSTKLTPVANWQPSQINGNGTTVPVSSSGPVTVAPRSRIPAAVPGSTLTPPRSKAEMTSALITGAVPAPEPPRSTQAPRGNASQSSCSTSVSSAGFMLPLWRLTSYPKAGQMPVTHRALPITVVTNSPHCDRGRGGVATYSNANLYLGDAWAFPPDLAPCLLVTVPRVS